jgi:ketopantoate hydroxymethyltransferase
LYSKVAITIYPSGKLEITDSTNGGIPVMTFIGLYPDEVLEYFDEYLNGFSSAELEALGIT